MDCFKETYNRSDAEQKWEINKAQQIFGRSIVRVMPQRALDLVIFYGKMFRSKMVRRQLIWDGQDCDSACSEEKMILIKFDHCEEYIDSIACYIQNKLFPLSIHWTE